MRNVIPFLAVTAFAAVFATGCAGPEQKLGRGVSDSLEFTRLGEMSRSIEQTSVFVSPSAGYTVGAIDGFDHSVARTAMGLYEIVTFPLPPYQPVCTSYIKPGPLYPESYKPGIMADSLFDTHSTTGFSGGDVVPFVPGCKFTVFGD
jgi:putative exosortase-associated protein (TIGR04073 family)